LRFTFVAEAYYPSTPHSSGFTRLASGAFYKAISLATFYEIIKILSGGIYFSFAGWMKPLWEEKRVKDYG
jgi:hypothetical protein